MTPAPPSREKLASMGALACAALAACGCNSAPAAAPKTASTRPRLVVLLVIEQWPKWSFEAKRPALHAGGFERLLAEGTWHVGRHPSAVTLTAPGHALIGTGATSAVSGIIANEWWHRDSGGVLASVEGGAFPVVGFPEGGHGGCPDIATARRGCRVS